MNWCVHLCLQENVSALTILKEENEEQQEVEAPEEEALPSALLQEKNQEIDHLNNEIQRLEQEMENTRDTKVRISTHRIHVDTVEVPVVDEATMKNVFVCLIVLIFLTNRFWRLSSRTCIRRWNTFSLKS